MGVGWKARKLLAANPLVRMLQLVLDKYQRDDVPSLAAALAYFALFSIFPLLLVVMSLVGFFVDPARFGVQQLLISLVGSVEVRDLIVQTLTAFGDNRVASGLIGIGILLFTATGIFGALNKAVREIWGARLIVEGGNLRTAVTTMVQNRLTFVGLLLGCALLILVSVVGNFALTLLSAYTEWFVLNSLLLRVSQILLTLLLLTVAFAVLYKVLPYPLAAWGDVWPAALTAALLFYGLQRLAEIIFGLFNFSSFGVLGSAMTLLTWIYFCCQILLIGVELSYAWAHVLGSRRNAAA